MKIKNIIFVFCALLMLVVVISILSLKPNNQTCWNQFRGSSRNGAFAEAKLNNSWCIKESQQVWRKNIGDSFSEVLVSRNKVFTMTSEKFDNGTGSEILVALDANTGNELWKTVIDSLYFDSNDFGDGARPTPALDKRVVYCLSSFGKLNALSRKNGEILWTVNIAKEFKTGISQWTYTSSPLLIDDVVVLEVGGLNSKGFAAFDKKTGDIVWVSGLAKPSYCSPTFAYIKGTKQIVFANDTMLYAFDAKGNELWSYRMPLQSPIPMPLFIAPNKIFVSSMGGCFMVQIDNNIPREIFVGTEMRNTFSSCCYHNGHIFGVSNDALKCISANDGALKWSEKGFGSGGLILVGEMLVVLNDEGLLKTVKAIPDNYSETGSVQVLHGRCWTAPSFAKGKLYLRNLEEIVSFNLEMDIDSEEFLDL